MGTAAAARMMRPILFTALAGFALAGCGQKLSGTYPAEGPATYEKIEFGSDEAVDVSFNGQVLHGAYKIDDKKLVITGVAPEPLVFTVDDQGCLNLVNRPGAMFEGKFCKAS